VFAPDGTQVFPEVEDTNGNYFSKDADGNMMDTLGRTPVATTTNGSQITYATINSKGTASNFVATTESLAVSTAFHESGITEFSGNITTVQKLTLPDGKFYSFGYDSYGELTSITLPTTGVINYTYNNFSDGLGNVNRWVNSHVSSGGTETFTPGQLSLSNCPSGVLACQQVTVARPSGAQAVYTFGINNGAWTAQVQYNSGSTTLATVADTWNFSNTCQLQNCTGAQRIQKMVETTSMQNFVNRTVQYTYDSVNDGNIVQIQEWKYTGTQPPTPDRITNIAYHAKIAKNIINRPSSITICPGSNPTCTTSAGAVAQTSISYDVAALTNVSGTIAQHDTNFGVSNGARGNVGTITRWVSTTSSSVSTSLSYDITGQVVQITDPALNHTNFSYADKFYSDNGANPPQAYTQTAVTNAYLTQITLPMTGTMTFGYYFNTGKRAFSKDQNGADSYSHFIDSAGLDRLTNVYSPLLNATRCWQLYNYTGETQVDAYTSITSTSPSSSCTSCVHTETLLDTLGRPTNTYLVNDPDGQTSAQTTYDTSSRVASATLPYRGSVNGQDTFTYDGLNRVTQVSHTDNQSVKTYFGSAVTSGVGGITSPLCYSATYPTLVVDEAGKKRQSWTDGFGNLTEVDEPDSSNNLTAHTCYSYDLNNNLKTVQQSGQTRSYLYDGTSRVTEVGIPETTLPDGRGGFQAHPTTYAYLTATGQACSGNPAAVCQRTDGRGIVTTYTYDAMNRLTSITYTDSTPAVVYCYDGNNTACGTSLSISSGLGRRTAMADGSGNTAWSYYATGQVQTEQRTIGTVTKSISYTYNLNGSIATITYPSGHTITYTTGNAGRPQSATDTASGINYALTASYAPTGGLAGVIYGKVTGGFTGVSEGRSYNNRSELFSVTETANSVLKMSLSYCFSSSFTLASGCPTGTPANNNGSATGITNGVYSGETQGPTYDNLNRIASDKTAGTTGSDCWGQGFTIDAVSNLTGMATTLCSTGTLSASTDGNNHLTNTQGSYTYDNAGNMTNDGVFAYSYDAENRITTAAGVTYTYDGNGLRVEKSSGTLYWRSLTGDTIAESDLSGNITSEYAYFAGRKIARRDGNGNVFYLYSDNLGTIHTITDSSGNACYDASFTPYGQEVLNPNISNTCGINYKFTGYERDTETQVDYAVARYYNYRLGRFLTTDPLGGSAFYPQSLNLYSYVENDPLNGIDPSGMRNVNGYRNPGGSINFGALLSLSFWLGWDGITGECTADMLPISCEGLQSLFVGGAVGFRCPGDCFGIVQTPDGLYGSWQYQLRETGQSCLVLPDGTCPPVNARLDYQLTFVASGGPTTFYGTFQDTEVFFQAVGTNAVNEFKKGGCGTSFLNGIDEADILGFLPPSDTLVEDSVKIGAQMYAADYAKNQLLTVPFRSSVVRGIISGGEAVAETFAPAYGLYLVLGGVTRETVDFAQGKCR